MAKATLLSGLLRSAQSGGEAPAAGAATSAVARGVAGLNLSRTGALACSVPTALGVSGALGTRLSPWACLPGAFLGAQDGFFYGGSKLPQMLATRLEARLGSASGFGWSNAAVLAFEGLPFGWLADARPNLQLSRQVRDGGRARSGALQPGSRSGGFEHVHGGLASLNGYLEIAGIGVPLGFSRENTVTLDHDGSRQKTASPAEKAAPRSFTTVVSDWFWRGVTAPTLVSGHVPLGSDGSRKLYRRQVFACGAHFDQWLRALQIRVRYFRRHLDELQIQRQNLTHPRRYELHLRHRREGEVRVTFGAAALSAALFPLASLLRLLAPQLWLQRFAERRTEARFSRVEAAPQGLDCATLQAPWQRAQTIVGELDAGNVDASRLKSVFARLREGGDASSGLGRVHEVCCDTLQSQRARLGTLVNFLPWRNAILPGFFERTQGWGERLRLRVNSAGRQEQTYEEVSWVERERHTDARVHSRTAADAVFSDAARRHLQRLKLQAKITFNHRGEHWQEAGEGDVARLLGEVQAAFGERAPSLPTKQLPGERSLTLAYDVQPAELEALVTHWAHRPLATDVGARCGLAPQSVAKLHADLRASPDAAGACAAIRTFLQQAEGAAASAMLPACQLAADVRAMAFLRQLCVNVARQQERQAPALHRTYRCQRHDDALLTADVVLARYQDGPVPRQPLALANRVARLRAALDGLTRVQAELEQLAGFVDEKVSKKTLDVVVRQQSKLREMLNPARAFSQPSQARKR